MKTLILILILITGFLKNARSQSGWFHQNSGCNNSLLAVAFINVDTGFCVGSSGKILMTKNGGSNWDSLISPTTNTLLSITIVDPNIILACGVARTIIKTTNSGSSWYRITNISDGQNLEWIQFVDQNTGFIASFAGIILKTTNTGESWFELDQPYPFPLVDSFNSLFFFNGNSGYVVGEGNIPRSPIIKTTNGGLNWFRQESSTISSLYSIKFVNQDTGLICGAFGTLRRTTNGGANWIYILGPVNSFEDLSYPSNLIAYAVGGNGTIIKTTNGGINWESQVSNTTEHFGGIYFIDEYTGYAVGGNGTILKTTTGGVVGININSNQVPEDFSLKQNYPNPFNPITHIEFSISKNNSFVKLNVFDNAGREIGYIVNQKLDAGTYTVDFSAAHLASGMYFYRIEVNNNNPNSSGEINFTETKSMVLLK